MSLLYLLICYFFCFNNKYQTLHFLNIHFFNILNELGDISIFLYSQEKYYFIYKYIYISAAGTDIIQQRAVRYKRRQVVLNSNLYYVTVCVLIRLINTIKINYQYKR